MKTRKTKSESVFESFLSLNQIPFEPIPTSGSRAPDYLVTCGVAKIVFEVKELFEDENFSTKPLTTSSRIVGDHIRSKISQAKRQVQWGAQQGFASVLLVYNNLDTQLQLFGTEDQDFLCAMYGEYTLKIDKQSGQVGDAFYGRNHALAPGKNTSFSALGRLLDRQGSIEITLFENAFAERPISYDQLSPCWKVIRVQVSN
ncbi:MAG TPA: hypothetical protein VGF43_12430 [Dongiaceae bacterium]